VTDRLRVGITGASGRMGATLIAAVRAADDLALTAATERPDSPAIGRDAGLVSGTGPAGVSITGDLAGVLGQVDVVIDFTTPEASRHHVAQCVAAKRAIVVGTTGLSAEDKQVITVAANEIPILLAPNMSVGVNLLFTIAAEVARVLGEDYDVEIVESHHRMKKDSPSGTALRLAEVLADAMGIDAKQDLVKSRDGNIGERPKRTIGIQAVRGGDVVGDHTVFFLGQGERVELTHRATSRGNFAQGAVRGARWLAKKAPGLYDMQDVLGLKGNR
jgi:4-hydroxy-tetrahydrodipicolinate reductase